MHKFLFLFLYIAYYEACLGGPIYDDTELALAFLVSRHGDRTSILGSLQYSTNPEKMREMTEPYGFGQLTNEGIERAYELGKFIRQRYNDVLSPKYNKSEIYIRATDSTRTKMSILAAMAAVYPPNERAWNPQLNWTPTPYTTVPASSDSNLATINCPEVFDYNKIINSYPLEFIEYADLFEELAKVWYDFREAPLHLMEAYDTLVAQIGMGLPIGSKLEPLFPKIQEVAFKIWDYIYANEDYLNVISGTLLNSFLNFADKAIAGEPTPKVRILSGHDFSVYPFLAIAQAVPRPGIPKFGSMFGLELRKVIKTGQYVVIPIYLSQPGEELQYLKIKGCDAQPCDLEQFRYLTSKYALTEREWRSKCNNMDNDVDLSLID